MYQKWYVNATYEISKTKRYVARHSPSRQRESAANGKRFYLDFERDRSSIPEARAVELRERLCDTFQRHAHPFPGHADRQRCTGLENVHELRLGGRV